jgi:chemotaxis signal transduction protein
MTNNYLLFRVAERLLGVKLQGAIEILPWRRSRPVPLAYSYIEGIMEYRGAIYPVFHLAQVLGLSRTGPIGFTAHAPADDELRKGQSIILLEEGGKPFGITVDSVVKMVRLDDPKSLPAESKGIDMKLVKGIQFVDDQEITLLNFERLFHAG